MTDTQSNPINDELATLKAQADLMGIEYGTNIGVATLRERIADRLNDKGNAEASQGTELSQDQLILAQRAEALKLVRVIVTPFDMAKKEYQGEIFTVSNAVIGTVRKYVLFNEPFHVEQIILDQLREKKHQVFNTRKNSHGVPVRESKLINAYGIQELPPLTKEELAELAKAQQAANRID